MRKQSNQIVHMSKSLNTEDRYYQRVATALNDLWFVGDPFLQRSEWPGSTRSAIVSEILDIVEDFPTVSCRMYSTGRAAHMDGRRGTILLLFLLQQVGVELLERLVDICPDLDDLLSPPSEIPYEDCPLHVACKYCSIEVIEYVASLKPPNLLLKSVVHGEDDELKIPLLYAMENDHASFRENLNINLAKVIELCPRALQDNDVWEKAFLSNYSPAFLDWMVEKSLSSGYCPSKFCLQRGELSPLSLHESKVICRLLPQLKSICIESATWERAALLFFLKELTNNNSVSFVSITLAATDENEMGEEGRKEIQNAFREVLEINTALRCISTGISDANSTAIVQSWLNMVQEALENNETLLKCIFCTGDYMHSKFSCLKLITTRAEDSSWHEDLTLYGNDFSLVTSHDTKYFTRCKLRLVDSRPLSGTVQPSRPSEADATSAVLSILSNSSHLLHELSLHSDIDLNPVPILEYLKTDKQLERISFLDKHAGCNSYKEARGEMLHINSTLKWCCPSSTDSKVEELLTLNMFGRAQAREFGGHTLISLLREAFNGKMSHSNDFLPGKRLDKEAEKIGGPGEDDPKGPLRETKKLSVIYGLLLQAPNLWCTPAYQIQVPCFNTTSTERKRKDPPS